MNDEPMIRRLAKWVTAFDAGKIPADVVMQAKLLLLDTIGCAVAARGEEAFEAVFSAAAAVKARSLIEEATPGYSIDLCPHGG